MTNQYAVPFNLNGTQRALKIGFSEVATIDPILEKQYGYDFFHLLVNRMVENPQSETPTFHINADIIATIIWAGLKHEDPKLQKRQVIKDIDHDIASGNLSINQLIEIIVEAIDKSKVIDLEAESEEANNENDPLESSG